jgi:hypothetical protein
MLNSIGSSANAAQSAPILPGRYNDSSTISVEQDDSISGQASVSLNANLASASAATTTGQFTLEFAQALQSATTVDPSTGHREILAGASAQLVTTLNALLVQNGFTSAQAAAATSSLPAQLAQGGQINLSASFDQSTSNSQSIAIAYAQQSRSVNATSTLERAGSVSIGINLDTGSLNVSLNEADTSTYHAVGQINGVGTLTTPLASLLLLPSTVPANGSQNSTPGTAESNAFNASVGSPGSVGALQNLLDTSASALAAASSSPVSESETDSYSIAQRDTEVLTTTSAAPSNSTAPSGTAASANDAAQAAEAGLFTAATASSTSTVGSSTSVLGSALEQLRELLAQLANSALHDKHNPLGQQIDAASGTAAQGTAAAATGTGAGANADSSTSASTIDATVSSSTTSITLGFSQVLAVQQLDAQGYGATLYQRPDGSTAQFQAWPTRTTA